MKEYNIVLLWHYENSFGLFFSLVYLNKKLSMRIGYVIYIRSFSFIFCFMFEKNTGVENNDNFSHLKYSTKRPFLEPKKQVSHRYQSVRIKKDFTHKMMIHFISKVVKFYKSDSQEILYKFPEQIILEKHRKENRQT